MKRIITAFALSFFAVAFCSGMKTTGFSGDADGWKFDSLVYSRNVEINKAVIEDGMQLDISLVYPVAVPDGVDLAAVQNAFARIFLVDPSFEGTPQEAFDKMVAEYVGEAEGYADDYKNETADNTLFFRSFHREHALRVVFDKGYVLSVSSGGYSFTGGAHGMYGANIFNIDKRDGVVMTEQVLFRPGYKENLSALIQNVLAQRNLSADEDEHVGLFGEISEVKANGNFIFSDSGITYNFGIYEISSYAQGEIDVEIPYEQIIPLVNDKYLPVIQSVAQ